MAPAIRVATKGQLKKTRGMKASMGFNRDLYKTLKIGADPVPFPKWCTVNTPSESLGKMRHHLDANAAVVWDVLEEQSLPHYDHIEMSGFFAAAILSYGVNEDKSLKLHRHVVFPRLRKIPNNTYGSFSFGYGDEMSLEIHIGGKKLDKEYPDRISIRGNLEFQSETQMGIQISRKLFPSVNYPALIEKVTLVNQSDVLLAMDAKAPNIKYQSNIKKGVTGVYEAYAEMASASGEFALGQNHGFSFNLGPRETKTLYCVYCAVEAGAPLGFNVCEEEKARAAYVLEMQQSLRLETPDELINTAFDFAKIRACESIFETKRGLMHGPGGGVYYAALWTNDQCEYVNPFFPFVGYWAGNEEAINSYRLFMTHMDLACKRSLVSSICAEGDGFWNGVGDRGDGAMFAYGAARFCLAYGDEAIAQELWQGIQWGIQYSLNKKNHQGVIASDSDELENRFESGDANLFTSCLLYDALLSAGMLGKELGKPEALLSHYKLEALALRAAIEQTFGGMVEGFETYQYYEGNDVLRAWICIPLVMGILDRAKGTIEALFSPRLWTSNGLNSKAGDNTFWDRSTLYALRSVFAAGYPDLALEYLSIFTRQRMLGEHVPYAVEAYPEGNQRHLSAESGLYARVFVEGLFGMRPTGFHSFICKPQLPSEWPKASLRKIKAFGSCFDLELLREGSATRVRVIESGLLLLDKSVAVGEGIEVILKS